MGVDLNAQPRPTQSECDGMIGISPTLVGWKEVPVWPGGFKGPKEIGATLVIRYITAKYSRICIPVSVVVCYFVPFPLNWARERRSPK